MAEQGRAEPILPFDWEADRQELEDRLQELGFPPPPVPWVWIRTANPCPELGDVRLLIIAQAATNRVHAQYTDVPVGTDSWFTPSWSGYRYEAIGLFWRYRRGEWDVEITADDTDERPPMMRLSDPGASTLELEAALWWQRAYKPAEDGGAPPLVTELRWRPGMRGAHQSFAVLVLTDAEPTVQDFRAARAARGRLLALQPRLNKGGSPKGPRKGRVWQRRQCLEWWKAWDDLDRIPTQAELAAEMDLSDPETAVGRWRACGLHWPPTQEELDELENV